MAAHCLVEDDNATPNVSFHKCAQTANTSIAILNVYCVHYKIKKQTNKTSKQNKNKKNNETNKQTKESP